MKFVILGFLTLFATVSFANDCKKQATVAAQGIVNANPGFFRGGKVILKSVNTVSPETKYKYNISSNDGEITVKTVPDTEKNCYVYSVQLFMP